jgi:WD40 repeat protein
LNFFFFIINFFLLIKAIAWCPWEGSKILATGGGHSDGYLRFWNNSNGTCQQAIKTDSQVRRNLNIYFSIK